MVLSPKFFINKIKSGDKRSVTVKKNIIGSFLIKGISIVISLMLVPMTLGYVSSELYGIWLTLSSIMVWMNFFDIGFTLGLKNKLAEAIALEDWSKGKTLVSTTYFIMIIIFIPLCLILIYIIPYINWAKILNINTTYNIEITKVLYVMTTCFCIQMIANIITTVIAAYQKVALSTAFPVIGNFISLIIIYILTQFSSPSLLNLSLAISTIPAIILIISSIILFKKKFKRVSPNFRFINKKYIKDLWTLGFKFFFIQIQVIILYQCTNVLISHVSGPNEVTSYNIAYKYLSIIMMLFSTIITPLWPAFTDAYTKKDFSWMKKIYKKASQIYLLLFLGIVILVLISPYIYEIWIGNKTTVPLHMTIAVAIYMVIYTWDSLQVLLINGIGTIKLQTYVTLIGLIIHIPLALTLGKHMGAEGIITSMIIINTVYTIFFTKQINKLLNGTAHGIWKK